MVLPEGLQLSEARNIGVAAGLTLAREHNQQRLQVFIGPLSAILLPVVLKERMRVVVFPDGRKPINRFLASQAFTWIHSARHLVNIFVPRKLDLSGTERKSSCKEARAVGSDYPVSTGLDALIVGRRR